MRGKVHSVSKVRHVPCQACSLVEVLICLRCWFLVFFALRAAVSRGEGEGLETSATQWQRPWAFTHGSRRATLHGLAGCDLQVAPGELVLLKASCASYFVLAKYSTVQLFT